MNGHVVVVGSLNMDLVVHAPRLPQRGETILGSGFQTFPGGKGANQSVAVARLGARVKMIGRVGGDGFGASLKKNLLHEGVNATFVEPVAAASTGIALITVDQNGHNTIVVDPGANDMVTPRAVLEAADAFIGASVLIAQLECPLEAVEQAVAMARQHGLRTILNPAPARPLEPALLGQVDYLVPNQTELALLTRQDDIHAAVTCLHNLGVRCVVVTLGEQGVFISDDRRTTTLAAHSVSAVDTTAAGDAFVAAFAVAILRGGSTLEAARWGNAAGALAVTRAGAQPSLPTQAEVERLLAAFALSGEQIKDVS
jgi:ribokinase